MNKASSLSHAPFSGKRLFAGAAFEKGLLWMRDTRALCESVALTVPEVHSSRRFSHETASLM